MCILYDDVEINLLVKNKVELVQTDSIRLNNYKKFFKQYNYDICHN